MFREIIVSLFVKRLKPYLKEMLASGSRVNEAKEKQYWYPLGLASYDVEEIIEAIDSMTSFRTSMSEKTELFEKNFSHWQGCTHSVMVNSGSSANLTLALLLTNPIKPLINKGSKVLVPAVTWPTQVWSLMMAGLEPEFVDINPCTLNIDLDDLERKITPEVKAISLVHLMGNPCEMDKILEIARKHKLIVIEDCAEALGATWEGTKVGNFGIGSSFSFFFSHHITSMEGGMICVNEEEFSDHLKIMRTHGWTRNVNQDKFPLDDFAEIDKRYAFVNWGLNTKPTEVQAAFGLKQLEKVDIFTQKRSQLSDYFFSFLYKYEFFEKIIVHKKAEASWLGLPILVKESAPFAAKELINYLEESGVETRPILTGNLLRQPVSRSFFPTISPSDFKGAEYIHNNGLYIGLSPFITDDVIERLKETFESFLVKYGH